MEKSIIVEVKDCESGYDIHTKDSSGFILDKKYNVEPKVGDIIEFDTVNISTVRGLKLNNKSVFYKTDEDLKREHEEWLENNEREKQERFERNKHLMDFDYNFLPELFKKRIDRFRKANPRFRIDYEDYELFCCTEALKIAEALRGKTKEEMIEFGKADYDTQKKQVPDLSDGHSGNTFGTALRLAYWYLVNPENVVKEHGALVPLVGCDSYGCKHEVY